MFIILPVGMDYRTERLPIVTFTLIGINMLVYLVSLGFFFGTQGESDQWILQHLWLIPADSYSWAYLTSMFVHGGILHLAGNMIFLFLFGACVEDIIGRWRFLAFYLIGGLVAEFVYIATSPAHFASEIPMGGASGAISACMGMYLLLRTSSKIEFKYFYWLFLFAAGSGEFDLAAWVAITFWFLNDLLWTVVGMFNHQMAGGVAFGAHVGGLLAGLALVGVTKIVPRKRPRIPADFGIRVVQRPAPVSVSVSETPTIYLLDRGEQSGPFTLAQIQAMLASGSINQDAWYWSEGLDEWQKVTDLSGQPTV
ncbi:MAG: rhomboid family intramembrane serine protease [Verrucomicrobiota bacterium]|jgi:membrane associated rhomboid family serine protease